MKRYLYIVTLLIIITALAFSSNGRNHSISGYVMDGPAPLMNARVRIKAHDNFVVTDKNGRFSLNRIGSVDTLVVTAWHEGYYINGVEVPPGLDSMEIVLRRHPVTDNPSYRWVNPDPDSTNELGCGNCHSSLYKQWRGSSHAIAAVNPIVLDMYNGTDAFGNDNVQPGYKLDFKQTQGNCVTCHAPGAATDDPYQIDLDGLAGVEARGVFCDFCHKIKAVRLNPKRNMPGILSIELLRPGASADNDEEDQIFFGPYDDVDLGRDSYNPLYQKSEICAPCHMHSSWGTPIYQSFPEWLASPYAQEGIQCQDCHMKPDGLTTNIAPGKGGVERRPETIFTHGMPGSRDSTFLSSAVQMNVETALKTDTLNIVVQIKNVGAGHHVPTGQPMRNMILLVEATDERGRALAYVGDHRIPTWGGKGDPEKGNYAGLPGKGFAKVLADASQRSPSWKSRKWAPVFPTPHWRPAIIVEDNRIPARESDVSSYDFLVTPGLDGATVNVRLIYRRAFKTLTDHKEWDLRDRVLARENMSVKLK